MKGEIDEGSDCLGNSRRDVRCDMRDILFLPPVAEPRMEEVSLRLRKGYTSQAFVMRTRPLPRDEVFWRKSSALSRLSQEA